MTIIFSHLPAKINYYDFNNFKFLFTLVNAIYNSLKLVPLFALGTLLF